MNSFVNNIGGRKAAACLIGLAVLVGCFLYKGALPSELVESVQYLITTYLAGNIAADVVEGVQNASVKKAEIAAQVPVSPQSAQEFQAITQRISSIEQAVATQDQTLRQVVNVIQSK
jgi:hypothetical protein